MIRPMSSVRCALCLGALLLALGCSREERPPAEPAPPAPAQAPTLPVELEPTPEEVPVIEDFEAEAEQQITTENYKAELDALEKELATASK